MVARAQPHGVAVAVVKDGELSSAEGYGYAGLESGIPVDPEETIFRIGSVGKLLTALEVSSLPGLSNFANY